MNSCSESTTASHICSYIQSASNIQTNCYHDDDDNDNDDDDDDDDERLTRDVTKTTLPKAKARKRPQAPRIRPRW